MEGVKVQIVLAEKQHLWRRHEQSGAAESDTIHSRRLCVKRWTTALTTDTFLLILWSHL